LTLHWCTDPISLGTAPHHFEKDSPSNPSQVLFFSHGWYGNKTSSSRHLIRQPHFTASPSAPLHTELSLEHLYFLRCRPGDKSAIPSQPTRREQDFELRNTRKPDGNHRDGGPRPEQKPLVAHRSRAARSFFPFGS
jgi:hypothetical protein